MTEPSDFSPQRALEVRGERQVNRHVWALRVAGGILLVMGWGAVAGPHWGETEFALNTAVFLALGVYGFLGAAQSRRTAINLERKLRLGLLMHNIELENMAMRDELTQLFNRRHFFERLERELETARGFHKPLAVMVANVDGMREINEVYGYAMGDKVLASLGAFLLECTRGSDVPARVGDDEFAIILPDTSESAATMLMDRLRQRLSRADLLRDEDVDLQVRASLGVSGYPWGGQTAEAIVKAAVASMRASKWKRQGENGGSGGLLTEDGMPAIFLREADADPRSGQS